MTTAVLELKVNGEPVRLPQAAASVSDLLAALGYQNPFLAVAVNRACVRRAEYGATALRPGDEVEILAPMAGG